MKIDQNTAMGKKKRKNDLHVQKTNKPMEVETQQVIGCKMRFLVGYENGKTFATITTTKEEVDYQCWYPGRKKSSKNTSTSRTFIPGVMKMTVNWVLQIQLIIHALQKSTICRLL